MMTVRTGTVTEFDDPRGIGVVTGADGTEYPFHCTAILDCTRQIDIGASVRFVDRPGRQGRWEATEIAPV